MMYQIGKGCRKEKEKKESNRWTFLIGVSHVVYINQIIAYRNTWLGNTIVTFVIKDTHREKLVLY